MAPVGAPSDFFNHTSIDNDQLIGIKRLLHQEDMHKISRSDTGLSYSLGHTQFKDTV